MLSEPYTAREALLHLRHVRDILRGPTGQLTDAYTASEGASLSFVMTILGNTLVFGNLITLFRSLMLCFT